MKLVILLLTFVLIMNVYNVYITYNSLKKESYFCRDGSCYTTMTINFESDDEKRVYPPQPKQREIQDDVESIPFPNWEPCQCSGLYTQISYS